MIKHTDEVICLLVAEDQDIIPDNSQEDTVCPLQYTFWSRKYESQYKMHALCLQPFLIIWIQINRKYKQCGCNWIQRQASKNVTIIIPRKKIEC
jgi:hypothetical protein